MYHENLILYLLINLLRANTINLATWPVFLFLIHFSVTLLKQTIVFNTFLFLFFFNARRNNIYKDWWITF